MTDDNAATEPLALVQARGILAGDVPDGTYVAVHGNLDVVTVTADEQSGQWATGRLVDAEDSIEFMIFPRAFARTGQACVEADGQITATARVSISTERTALVINSIERIEPRTEPGVDHTAL